MGLRKEETEVKAKHNIIKEVIESKKIRLTNSLDVEAAIEFINLIHTQTQNKGKKVGENKDKKDKKDAYFSLVHLRKINKVKRKKSKKDKEIHHWSFKDVDFNTLQKIMCLKDVYISINAFYKPVRQNKCVRKLNAFWVDLDYYNKEKYKDKTAEEMIEILRQDGMFKDLEPSFFVDSGNGMYIFWLIKDIPKSWSKTWSQIENTLVEKFENYGADANSKDIARFLRLVGTINSKTGRKARLIKNGQVYRYGVLEVKAIVLKLRDSCNNSNNSNSENNNKNYNKNIKLRTIKNLNFNRMLDLTKLVELREGDVFGYRNIIVYMYALFYMYCYNNDIELKNNVVELNNRFKDTLEDVELKNIMTSAIDDYKHFLEIEKKYHQIKIKVEDDEEKISFTDFLRKNGCIIYTNISIIRALRITTEEMKHMETTITKEFKKQKKSDTNREYYYSKLEQKGKISKYEQILNLKQQIIELKQKKVKNKDIAITLKVNIKTLERHITNLKKEGLL